jgi:hypothetical protein
LYRCEKSSLVLREHGLSVFENRVLRRMFGSERDELTGGWRKLYKGELHNLTFSPRILNINKSRRMEWADYVARMGEKGNSRKVLVETPEG